ncbi:RWD domain-containing protein 2A [Xylocopa sonorina]|uniref:RWD domain-containing protein 2A n=1 Tax=Xylocopa sonorina TaxID=1818115 RepID=UPI00403AD105
MSTNEEISENFTAQICELEALQSVYPKELVITDHGVLADINEFIRNPKQELPQRLEYAIEISLNGGSIELLISLSSNYPNEKPDVYSRSSVLNRTQQLLLNQALSNVVKQQAEGESCIYALISWLQDNGEEYLAASNKDQEKDVDDRDKNKVEKPINFARYWIYSHHIYGKEKRKDVIALAKENSVTGFCLAGKPGIICMEGNFEDCDYCWQKLKSMNWHKILIRLIEKEEDCENVDSLRKFNDFQEISFPSSERHNDMGKVRKYLVEHKSQHVFKELFGIEGKSTELIINKT